MTNHAELLSRVKLLREQNPSKEWKIDTIQRMPWGIHKGVPLAKIPKNYMKFLDGKGFRQRWNHLFYFYDQEN